MRKFYKARKIIALLIATAIMVCSILPFFRIKASCHEDGGVGIATTYKVLLVDPYELIIQKMQEELETINIIEDKEQWFIAYKALVRKYEEVIDPPLTIYDYYTDEEINLIQRVVETECYDQDFESKVNVASVVFNRIEDINGRYGANVKEVVTAKNQFAYGREKITESTILAVEYAFQIEDTTNGCVAFRSDKSPATWYGWEYVFTDLAGHHFYKQRENK